MQLPDMHHAANVAGHNVGKCTTRPSQLLKMQANRLKNETIELVLRTAFNPRAVAIPPGNGKFSCLDFFCAVRNLMWFG